MRFAVALVVAVVAGSLPNAAGASSSPLDVLGSFGTVDATRTLLPGSNGAVAQNVSDGLFAALAKVLGGSAPRLNFVQQIGDGTVNATADIPNNAINVDQLMMRALVNPQDPYHNIAVNHLPHEDMHLRQTLAVLADMAQREGGAQAFADIVTNDAAKKAHVPYSAAGVSDSNYAPFVTEVLQKYGRDWVLGGQMGKQSVSWP